MPYVDEIMLNEFSNQSALSDFSSARSTGTETPLASTKPTPDIDNEQLPKFSTNCLDILKHSSLVQRGFNTVVNETAEYILANGDMKDQKSYGTFCKKLFFKYPSLDFSTSDSKEKPWVSFLIVFCSKTENKATYLMNFVLFKMF